MLWHLHLLLSPGHLGRWVALRLFHVMKMDSRLVTWALSDPITSLDDVNFGWKLGYISYWKGAAVIRMMESFLGAATLNKGLSSYLQDLAFSAAEEEDLFLHLEAAGLEAGVWPQPGVEDFSSVMRTWSRGAGLPLVTVTRLGGGGLRLGQARYTNRNTSTAQQLWSVPVTMADLAAPATDWEDTRPDLWLTGASVEVSAGPALPLLNKKAMGYYRVTYEDSIWRDIAAVLASDHTRVHPHNRAQVSSDDNVEISPQYNHLAR